MVDLQAVSLERHADKKWLKPPNFKFASGETVAQLSAHELLTAANFLPVAFIKPESEFIITAITGLEPNKNLLVGPNGSWIGRYLPEIYKVYPFRLGHTSDGQDLLCVDEGSGLVLDADLAADSDDAFSFYTAENQPSEALKKVEAALSLILQRNNASKKICAFLEENGLLKPWPITLLNSSASASEGDQESSTLNLQGFYCLDEAALNQLDGSRLTALRDIGGLWVACCQRLSMRHLKDLGAVHKLHQQVAPPEPILDSANDDGNISFENL